MDIGCRSQLNASAGDPAAQEPARGDVFAELAALAAPVALDVDVRALGFHVGT